MVVGTYLRLKVFAQNLQLYGRSPESAREVNKLRALDKRAANATNVVVDGVADAPCVETSCRTDCRLTGFEPPLCRAGTIVVGLRNPREYNSAVEQQQQQQAGIL